MSRADRYLEREVIAALSGVLLVMLIVVFGGLLTDVLNKIARGKIPAPLLFSQIGLRIPDALTLLLPLASLLGVLLAYGRLYRDSEMSVLAAAGYSSLRTLRPLLRMGMVLVAVQIGLAFFIAPAGRAIAHDMVESMQRSVAVAGLTSGRFVELPGGAGVLYVARVSTDMREVEELMLVRERDAGRLVLTARRGVIEVNPITEDILLRLEAGERVDGRPGEPGYRRIRFETADIAIPKQPLDTGDDPIQSQSTRDLLNADSIEASSELTRRLAQPIVLAMLLLLAPIMAQGAPRQPRYDKLVVAILLYVTYANLVELARIWAVAGKIPALLGTWWVHAVFAAVVIIAWGRELLAWHRGRLLLRQVEAQP